ncbi:MAG: hypothetical protein ACFFDN_51690 [Candidatus Hodarchaeota archaeon]
MPRNPLSLFFESFRKDPFETLDNLDLNFKGFQLNILRDDAKLRKAIFTIFFVPPLIAWVLLGADSTADQLAYFLVNVPNFLLQKITLNELFHIYNSWYGLGTHWSASVIYSLLLIGLSKHLREKLDIKNSENLVLTTGFVGFTIFSFEFFWWISYYFFQGQTWILSLWLPQLRLILQDSLFALPGIIIILGLNYKEFKFNFDKFTFLFFILTISTIFLWWFYPFPVTPLTVGTWTSNARFPQTMYTLYPEKLYYVADKGVHFVNNLVKIFMTLGFYSLFKLKRRE